jgi:hypothetical protein
MTMKRALAEGCKPVAVGTLPDDEALFLRGCEHLKGFLGVWGPTAAKAQATAAQQHRQVHQDSRKSACIRK